MVTQHQQNPRSVPGSEGLCQIPRSGSESGCRKVKWQGRHGRQGDSLLQSQDSSASQRSLYNFEFKEERGFLASSRLQMHASPQGVLNPYRMCTEHMGKCRAPKLHVRKGSTELCNSHSSLPGKRGSAQTGSHQQSPMWRGENTALRSAPAQCTCSYSGISLPQPWQGCSPSSPCYHSSSRASGPTPCCSRNSVLSQPAKREEPIILSTLGMLAAPSVSLTSVFAC